MVSVLASIRDAMVSMVTVLMILMKMGAFVELVTLPVPITNAFIIRSFVIERGTVQMVKTSIIAVRN